MVAPAKRRQSLFHCVCVVVLILIFVGHFNEVHASATPLSSRTTSSYLTSQQSPRVSIRDSVVNSIQFQWGIPFPVSGCTGKRILSKQSSDSFNDIVSSISRSRLLSVSQNAARTLLIRADRKSTNTKRFSSCIGDDVQQSLHDYSFPAIIRNNSKRQRQLLSQTIDISTKAISNVQTYVVQPLSRELSQAGVFFGLSPKGLIDSYSTAQRQPKPKRIDLRDGMMEALDELRTMRQEMEQLRKDMHILQQQLSKRSDSDAYDDDDDDGPNSMLKMEDLKKYKVKRLKEFEKISKDVEEWAKQLLFSDQSSDVDWSEIKCSSVLSGKFNPTGATKCFLTFMKDGRTISSVKKKSKNQPDDVIFYDKNEEYPCVKMFSTLDAPLEEVCIYLSNEKHAFDYNSLLQDYNDLEIVSPSSKICWAQTPQILFVKPKDFITFCSHRWLNDGTQIVINHSLNQHIDAKTNIKKQANAYAFRGATVIRRDPDNPTTKTQVYMLSHASAGSDIPIWAMRTAIKSLVPIEPFRLFYRMNKGVQESKSELQSQYQQLLLQHQNNVQRLSNDSVEFAEFVSTGTNAPSSPVPTISDQQESQNTNNNVPVTSELENNNIHNKKDKNGNTSWLPGGIAQLGYACFWPAGGGKLEEETSHTVKLSAVPQQPQGGQEKGDYQQQEQQRAAAAQMHKRENNRQNKSMNEVFESSSSTTVIAQKPKQGEESIISKQINVDAKTQIKSKNPRLMTEKDIPYPVVTGPVPTVFMPDSGHNDNNNIIIDRRLAIPAGLW